MMIKIQKPIQYYNKLKNNNYSQNDLNMILHM